MAHNPEQRRTTPDRIPGAREATTRRGFLGRLLRGRAEVGEKYDVRTPLVRLFSRRNRSCVAWLWRASKGLRTQIAALLAVAVTLNVVAVRLALVSKDMLDAVQVSDLDRFVRAAVLLIVATVTVEGAVYVNSHLVDRMRQRVLLRLRTRAFHLLVSKDYGEVSRSGTQDLINRLMSDTDKAAVTVVSLPIAMAQLLTTFLTAVGVLFELEPILVLVAALSVLPAVLAQRFTMPIVREFAEVERALNVRVSAFLHEDIAQMSVVRAFGAGERAERQADDVFEQQRSFMVDQSLWNAQLSILRTVYGVCVSTGLTVYCGWRILLGAMTFGSMGALATIFGQVRGPLKEMAALVPKLVASFVSVDRLRELEGFADQVGEMASEEEVAAFYEGMRSFGLRDAWYAYPAAEGEDDAGDVEPATATGAYATPGRESVLRGISVEIGKGEITAITGVSGWGKSTLIKALMGLCTLDAGERYARTRTGEVPLTAYHQRLFAFVPQGNHLVSGTIREVVSFGTAESGGQDERVWDALRVACADGFVAELPRGLDTVLGELGSGLSEGQMQRIAIARAIFSGHPILVLDESTSALDGDTEGRLLTNLRDLSGRTVIVVTHRQSVVDICDQNLHVGSKEL